MLFRNFSNTYQFFKKSYRGFFEIYQENYQKGGLKIAFYVDVNVFSLSNLTILKANISKTSLERYRFLFVFVCRTSKYTHMQKIKKILPWGQLHTSGFKIDDSEKNLDPRGLSAPTPGQYTCILQWYSKIFSSETAWPIKTKLYEEHC